MSLSEKVSNNQHLIERVFCIGWLCIEGLWCCFVKTAKTVLVNPSFSSILYTISAVPLLSFSPVLTTLGCAKFGAFFVKVHTFQGALCGFIAGQLSFWRILLSKVEAVHL